MVFPELVAVILSIPALVSVMVLADESFPAPFTSRVVLVWPELAVGMVTVKGAMPLVSLEGRPVKEEIVWEALLTTKEVVT